MLWTGPPRARPGRARGRIARPRRSSRPGAGSRATDLSRCSQHGGRPRAMAVPRRSRRGAASRVTKRPRHSPPGTDSLVTGPSRSSRRGAHSRAMKLPRLSRRGAPRPATGPARRKRVPELSKGPRVGVWIWTWRRARGSRAGALPLVRRVVLRPPRRRLSFGVWTMPQRLSRSRVPGQQPTIHGLRPMAATRQEPVAVGRPVLALGAPVRATPVPGEISRRPPGVLSRPQDLSRRQWLGALDRAVRLQRRLRAGLGVAGSRPAVGALDQVLLVLVRAAASPRRRAAGARRRSRPVEAVGLRVRSCRCSSAVGSRW